MIDNQPFTSFYLQPSFRQAFYLDWFTCNYAYPPACFVWLLNISMLHVNGNAYNIKYKI